jgi:hypothetical protein
MGFEPTLPVFEQAKTFHALDRAPTVNRLASERAKTFHALDRAATVIDYLHLVITRNHWKLLQQK